MTEIEIEQAADQYRKITGKEPSLAWYAEQGDTQARHIIDFIGFSTMIAMTAIIVVGIISVVNIIQGGI